MMELLFFSIGCLLSVHGLHMSGSFQADRDQWEVIGKFCFDREGGQLTVEVNASLRLPHQKFLFYHDTGGIIAIYESDNSCQFKEYHATDYLSLTHDRRVEYSIGSLRPRWWYFAVSNCDDEEMHVPGYDLVMTNGGSHVSYEEEGIHETAITLLALYFLSVAAMGWIWHFARQNKGSHTEKVYAALIVAMLLEVAALIVEVADRKKYEADGLHNAALKEAALILSLLPQVVLVGLFVAISKGFQINSDSVNDRDTVIEVTLLYFIATVGMYWYEYTNPPPLVSSEYLFDSGAGLLIAGIRITMMVWFLGSVYESWYKAQPGPERVFYKTFSIYGAVWFISLPTVVFFSLTLDEWNRMKVVTIFSWCLDFIFYWVLAYAFRGSAPYIFHMSSTGQRMSSAMGLETSPGEDDFDDKKADEF